MGERLSFASGYMEGTHAGRGAADCGAIKKKSACTGAGGLFIISIERNVLDGIFPRLLNILSNNRSLGQKLGGYFFYR